MEWAVHLTEKVNQISDLRVELWTTIFSPATGTLAWTVVSRDLQDLENLETKLMLDDGYLGLVEHGARYVCPESLTDGLVDIAYADPDAATRSQTASYSAIATMRIAPGHQAQVMEAGPLAAQRIKQVIGAPTSFCLGLTGPAGTVGFLSQFETLRQLQAAGEAIRGDAEFAAFLDASSVMVAPGSSTQTMWRKLA
ncbi:MAG TPA: hypothetical protein VE990_05475 [Acidimicrobiales bacterium]|nr:hypothetical protein [Acidimicrobiales bacterium]